MGCFCGYAGVRSAVSVVGAKVAKKLQVGGF